MLFKWISKEMMCCKGNNKIFFLSKTSYLIFKCKFNSDGKKTIISSIKVLVQFFTIKTIRKLAEKHRDSFKNMNDPLSIIKIQSTGCDF